jgi:hypothetical protein
MQCGKEKTLHIPEYKTKSFFLILHLKNGGSPYNQAQSWTHSVQVFV